ncbi:DUF2905 domain-containing protein [Candidatus Desantisbacteria bacterium CG_4_10_14_0_8_um_filter_48_22]|uniref:DUF2905 domain-containing protein n=1 Tax=Candidatus Desantisbacteria bacterium CG_4_10_14_0_8_um_filter_48_22 TaxID=1974543 RepID=A0A2M7SB50_9BACT|nr:MAG: hypothetical protein AUJ67_05355 [Candidatus Desantisbacteria bacterium CG1_02_49_89]PIV55763.1 MAG: DUF2905 domain-containing protein [Candidatus Desantisbacteria bacterium CG02_land_8_20_14_3_00_49_13]PIZ16689.1 MAG: DUF2905 domain-containing protein [Candidatus Desantisbacteria bacterium CG_4_10_14_0_8_um_filter_48_22]PJB28173.1 MAG: DUF2905 domain-containing protein [Candidatus Desantisbacteria bacterium CG_4_9_14_3_um_filter_50_7]
MNFNALGRTFIILGVLLAILGFALVVMHRMPGTGKLPGDIYIQKKNFSFFFPVTTCLIISAAISLLINLLGKK